jgi:hypothetical protein
MKIQLAGLVVVGMLVAACSSGGRPATTTTSHHDRHDDVDIAPYAIVGDRHRRAAQR